MRRPVANSALQRSFIQAAVLGALWLFGAALAGCAKPLLSPEESRSPFDRYDAVRGQAATQKTEDAYGRSMPNLRGRLEPKD